MIINKGVNAGYTNAAGEGELIPSLWTFESDNNALIGDDDIKMSYKLCY